MATAEEKYLNLMRTEHVDELEAELSTSRDIARTQMREIELLRGLIRRLFDSSGEFTGSNKDDRKKIAEIVTELNTTSNKKI